MAHDLSEVPDAGIRLRIVNRSNRLVRLLELTEAGMPDFVIRNEKRLLDEAFAEWERRHPLPV